MGLGGVGVSFIGLFYHLKIFFNENLCKIYFWINLKSAQWLSRDFNSMTLTGDSAAKLQNHLSNLWNLKMNMFGKYIWGFDYFGRFDMMFSFWILEEAHDGCLGTDFRGIFRYITRCLFQWKDFLGIRVPIIKICLSHDCLIFMMRIFIQ